MFKGLRESIDLVDLSSSEDTNIEDGRIDMTWDGILEMFSAHDVRSKKDGPCFMPAALKPREDWAATASMDSNRPVTYRNDQNIESISMVVLDLDREGALDRLHDVLEGVEYFVYSTHSYNARHPYKFRAVIRLDEPMEMRDWRASFDILAGTIGADPSCSNPSRLYFYPSHSPDADIEPHYEHREGRPLTVETIRQLDKRFTPVINIKRRSEVEIQGTPKISRRHFSGSSDATGKTIGLDYSYQAMLKRHKSSVDRLCVEDSRHAFALSVIAREVAIQRDKTELYPLYQFLFRACRDHGTKPLHLGNTVREIPELTQSAYMKFSCSTENLHNDIPDSLDRASKADRSGRWHFPKKVRQALSSTANGAQYSLSSCRKRHYESMRALMGHKDVAQFAKDVFETEYKAYDSDVDIHYCTQFIYYCAHGMHVAVGSGSPPKSELANITAKIAAADVLPAGLSSTVNDKKLVTLCKLAEKTTLDERWLFQKSKEPANPELEMSGP